MSGLTDQPTNPLRGLTIRGEWETLGVMKGQYVTQRPSVFFASMIQQVVTGQVKLSPTDPFSGKTILTCHGLINDG